ncbi:MAG: EamA family transporter, partial [Actinobacteria bacterium]|nr:EamA family transporter [Actinomycetota bacterium]
MSTQAWLIFVALSLVWGVPYLFIKIAVTEVEPMPLTGIRTLMAALILLPFALRSGSLRAALRAWPWVVAFALIEIALPWALLAHSEERISSGFAAVMIATVPIVGSLISWIEGDRHALTRVRVVGLVTGVVGVAILVG